jgi:hypothetical protein
MRLRISIFCLSVLLFSVQACAGATINGIDAPGEQEDDTTKYIKPPRSPLTYCLFAGKQLILTGNASTGAIHSKKSVSEIIDEHGDVGSNANAFIGCNTKVLGATIARDIYQTQNIIILEHSIISGEEYMPRPVRLPIALEPSADKHEVKALIKSGIVQNIKANEIGVLGTIVLRDNDQLIIPSGDYIANSISLSEEAKVQLPKGDKGAVRIFLQSIPEDKVLGKLVKMPVRPVVTIDGRAAVNDMGVPAQLQFWTNEDAGFEFGGKARINSVVYAPSSIVSIGGTDTRLTGSFTAGRVIVNGNARVIRDLDLEIGEFKF